MGEQLGITWEQTGLVVLTTTAMYLLLVGCVRLLGQRRLAGLSAADLGCVLAVGAVFGRTTLLLHPTLMTGVVAMLTLFAAQSVLHWLRSGRRGHRMVDRDAVLLMAGPVPIKDAMRANQVTEDDLRQRLRLAGIRRLTEVRCVVLERNGSISVIRQGVEVDSWLLADLPEDARLRAPAGPTDAGSRPEHDVQAPPA